MQNGQTPYASKRYRCYNPAHVRYHICPSTSIAVASTFPQSGTLGAQRSPSTTRARKFRCRFRNFDGHVRYDSGADLHLSGRSRCTECSHCADIQMDSVLCIRCCKWLACRSDSNPIWRSWSFGRATLFTEIFACALVLCAPHAVYDGSRVLQIAGLHLMELHAAFKPKCIPTKRTETVACLECTA